MKLEDFTVGTWYKITGCLPDYEWKKGDLVKLEPNGSITCIEAGGWIDAENASAAASSIISMCIAEEFYDDKIEKLTKEIKQLRKLKRPTK